MAVYLNWDNLKVKGDATESGHKDWIKIDSLQWGLARGVASATGSVKNREASAPHVSELNFTKQNDAASHGLLAAGLTGDGSATVVIELCRTDAGKLTVFQKIELTNVIISGYSVSAAGDRPTEHLSLNFTKVAVTDTTMGPDGKPGSPATVTYDLALAQQT